MDILPKEDKKYIQAKKRVQQLKGFYTHLIMYMIVNIFIAIITNYFDVTIRLFGDLIITNKITSSGFEFYPLWFLWGIILLVNAFKVFGFSFVLGKNWQDKKIKEFMDEKHTRK